MFVERIDISGNVRSLDKVVRREMRLVEGDAFNRSKVRRSEERIQNLDFFDNVTVEEVPGSAPDKTIIKVEVEEKSTGTLSLGAGFSSTNGALVEVGVQERNLLGRGWDIRLNSILAQRQSQIDLRFTDPAFLDREITAGFDVFRTSTDLQDTSSFVRETLGVALRGGYPITERLSQRWKYTLREADISDIDSSASRFIQSQSGSTIRSEISQRLTYDRRDSTVTPTKGYFVRLTNDVAGLGGDASYFRNRLGGVHYYSFKDQWVLASSASGGVIAGIGEDVRLSDRFFVGGDELRGFADAGIGPRDTNTRDALGGEWFYLASLQLTLPSGLPPELGISARVFTDWGSQGKVEPSGSDVSDTGSLRASIGAGVSWESPFGPVGLDFGIPLLKESFDVTEIVRVNFGARFLIMTFNRLMPIVLGVALWAVPFSGFEAAAQTPENPGVLVKMAVIDVQAILRNATAVKSVRSQIDKYRESFQGEIEKEEKEIVNANQELGRQRAILAPEAYNDERRKFESRVVDAQRLVQMRKQSLNEVLNQAMGEVQKMLNDVYYRIVQGAQFHPALSQGSDDTRDPGAGNNPYRP